MILPETFVWADGKRPSLRRPGSIESWAQWHVDMGYDFVIMFINQTTSHGENWRDEDLLAASGALRAKGIGVKWMFWAFSKIEAVKRQLRDLDKFYASFIPDGVQWDSEESWGHGSKKAAKLLNDGLRALNEKYGCNPEYSITAISRYRAREFSSAVMMLMSMPMLTMGYGQAYLFWNPKVATKTHKDGSTYRKPHWSQGLSRKSGEFQRGVTEAWMKVIADGLLEGYYLGNAAHFQSWPAKYDIPPFVAMEWGIESMYDLREEYGDCIRGTGHWSRKHLLGSGAKGKRDVIRSAKKATPEARRIQELLNEKSYSCKITGVIKPDTRLRALQYLRDTKYTPDEWESAELVELLRMHTNLV